MKKQISEKSSRKTFQPDDERQLVMDLRTPIDMEWFRKQAMKHVCLMGAERPYKRKNKSA